MTIGNGTVRSGAVACLMAAEAAMPVGRLYEKSSRILWAKPSRSRLPAETSIMGW
jgi:hypothetical protein